MLASRLSAVTEAQIKSESDGITSKSMRITETQCGRSISLGGHIASNQRGA